MKVLHLLTSGQAGGIESLCRDIGIYSDFENLFCFFTNEGAIYDQMANNGLNVICLKEFGKKFSIKKIIKLVELSKDVDIIIVHHGDPFIKLYFIILKFITKKKMVSVIHSCYTPASCKRFEKLKKIIWDIILKKSLKVSDGVIYVSNAGKASYEKKFPNIKIRSFIVYNGISPQKIIDGKMNTISIDPPINITYIGRLSSIKGIDNLIRAVAIVNKSDAVLLSIVGDGEDRKRLEKLVQDLNIDSITTFYGQQTDVASYLKRASIFVYPSICPEVFGISIVEAMAYGVPCISNNVGGIPEVIKNGVSGLLCDTFDPDELASKINTIIGQDNTQMILEGRKTAEYFSIENTVKGMQQVFEEIIRCGK